MEPLGTHPKSRMLLAREYRTFFFNGAPLYAVDYWETGDYMGEPPPPDVFAEAAPRRQPLLHDGMSPRISVGTGFIVELGDAQAAGLPERTEPAAFYRALADHWPVG